jgi:hypothetical protein
MKILMFYCQQFAYTPAVKNLEWAEGNPSGKSFENTQVFFIQVEEHDQENETSSVKKLANFIKWVSRKNECNQVLLHSFAHLSESKAEASFTQQVFNRVDERLRKAEFIVDQTPFGYFLDLKMEAAGYSMARVFKSF